MNASVGLRLALLGAIWGGSFLLQRVAVPALGPGLVSFGRIALAALAMLLLTRSLGRRLHWRSRWHDFLVVGGMNSAIPFFLFAYAAPSLPSGYLALLNGMVPMFTVLVAWAGGTPPTAGKSAGIMLGILGVGLIVGFGVVAINASTLLAFAAGATAALLYALATVQVRKRFLGVDPLVIATGSLCAAAPLLLPLAMISLPQAQVTVPALLCLVALGLICTALAYVLYFGLLHDAGAERATTVTLLVPVFALAFGAVLLSEPVTVSGVAGCVLVLLSIALIFGKLRWPGSR